MGRRRGASARAASAGERKLETGPVVPTHGVPRDWLPLMGIESLGAIPYKPGTLVELRNDNEPGFEGAWFIGTTRDARGRRRLAPAPGRRPAGPGGRRTDVSAPARARPAQRRCTS